MILSQTARKLMYDWHSGQFSALYGAASSGLVGSGDDKEARSGRAFDNLISEIKEITDEKDKDTLLKWVEHQKKHTRIVCIPDYGTVYAALPWYPPSKPDRGMHGFRE